MSYGATLIVVSILNREFRLQIASKFIKVKWLYLISVLVDIVYVHELH